MMIKKSSTIKWIKNVRDYVLIVPGVALAMLIAAGAVIWYLSATTPIALEDNKATCAPYRTYCPEIESALTTLAETHWDQYDYVRRNGVPIQQLNAMEFAKFGCRSKAYGCTGRDMIALNEAVVRKMATTGNARSNAVFRAAIISHELVHVQHHDPLGAGSKHSWSRHTFVRDEEAEAHMTGNLTLLRLAHLSDFTFGSWVGILVNIAIEFPVYFAPFLSALLSLGGLVVVLRWFAKKVSANCRKAFRRLCGVGV